MKLKKTFLLLTLALVSTWAVAQEKIDYSVYEDKCNFYIANDLGRNGYYDQKPIAELMGVMAEEVGPECVIAAGDIHHFEGVISVQDPLWMTNYELIYAHPELMIAWYPICGNHEYRGATQAVVDYSRVSRRWEMPGRYYTKSFNEEGTTVRIVWIDTTPLIDKYRQETDKYPDACQQDIRHAGRRQGRLGRRRGPSPHLRRDLEGRRGAPGHAAPRGHHPAPPPRGHVHQRTHPQLPAHPHEGQRD